MFNFNPMSHTNLSKKHRKEIKDHLLYLGGDAELLAMYDKTEQDSSDTWAALWVMWVFIVLGAFESIFVWGWIASGLVFLVLMVREIRYHNKFRKAWRETTRRYFKEKYNVEYTGK